VQPWAQGELAYWVSKMGSVEKVHTQVAEPWELLLQGNPLAAAERWRAIGRPYEHAIALAEGNTAERREALDEFDRLGAVPMAHLLRRELRTAGVRMLPRELRATTRTNPFNLTNREVEVLRLLGESLRDSQIADRLHLSVKTVGHHVSAILAKFGMHSRGAAVALARVRGILDPEPTSTPR
ncbi:MAG TPA: LuxR C-terminal-related transcriptional regulator, partial [Steroidobacteraceae bacterium]|nr:LuxR C-terminal-related transcriptional regulator [Steroidobacteraceae bacterium]